MKIDVEMDLLEEEYFEGVPQTQRDFTFFDDGEHLSEAEYDEELWADGITPTEEAFLRGVKMAEGNDDEL